MNRPGLADNSLARVVPSSIVADRPDTRIVCRVLLADDHCDDVPILRIQSMR